ncbi:MAG: thioredoxin TrxC [Dongiaceae bacterium]
MIAQLVQVVCPSCNVLNRIPRERLADRGKCGNCHNPIFGGKPASVDAAGFDRHISRNEIPVVVDFWALWCGPCLAMAPAFEQAAAELEPQYRLLKVDTEAVPDVAARYNIRSIPTMIIFLDGKPVAQQAGAMDKNRILAWVRSETPR